jgi:hypothetical protein
MVATVTLQRRTEWYNRHAVVVQKVWRGYCSRTTVFDYYERKAYVRSIEQKVRLYNIANDFVDEGD